MHTFDNYILVEFFFARFNPGMCDRELWNELTTRPLDHLHLGLDARKPVFGGLQTTQAQISLRIRAVWSAPLLFAFWKVSYVNLLQGKFQVSS